MKLRILIALLCAVCIGIFAVPAMSASFFDGFESYAPTTNWDPAPPSVTDWTKHTNNPAGTTGVLEISADAAKNGAVGLVQSDLITFNYTSFADWLKYLDKTTDPKQAFGGWFKFIAGATDYGYDYSRFGLFAQTDDSDYVIWADAFKASYGQGVEGAGAPGGITFDRDVWYYLRFEFDYNAKKQRIGIGTAEDTLTFGEWADMRNDKQITKTSIILNGKLYVDDVSWTSFSLGDIDATINLPNYTGDWNLTILKIEVLDSEGNVIQTKSITGPAETNSFKTTLAPGTYFVRASAIKWLTRTVQVEVAADIATPVTIDLPNGDINGDGKINVADYNTLKTNWFKINN